VRVFFKTLKNRKNNTELGGGGCVFSQLHPIGGGEGYKTITGWGCGAGVFKRVNSEHPPPSGAVG